jgi:hypothetical protein
MEALTKATLRPPQNAKGSAACLISTSSTWVTGLKEVETAAVFRLATMAIFSTDNLIMASDKDMEFFFKQTGPNMKETFAKINDTDTE